MKKSSREIDIFMATHILGHEIYHEKTGSVREQLPSGQSRPLRPYSEDSGAAWEIV